MLPYRSTHHSSDCNETFTSCCKHARGGFGNVKKFKIVLAGVPGVALHSDLDEILHKCCCKHACSGFGNVTNLKTTVAGVHCAAIHSVLHEILHKCWVILHFSVIN